MVVGPKDMRARELALFSHVVALLRESLAPHLGNTLKLALKAQVYMSLNQPKGMKAGELTLHPANGVIG